LLELGSALFLCNDIRKGDSIVISDAGYMVLEIFLKIEVFVCMRKMKLHKTFLRFD
jgi:hypothetical protein